MIENLKKENIKISILGVMLTLATLYSLIFNFDSYAWIYGWDSLLGAFYIY